jgi:hypothetical protein
MIFLKQDQQPAVKLISSLQIDTAKGLLLVKKWIQTKSNLVLGITPKPLAL